MYFVYILRCVDSSLYCGYTTDVAHRIKAHSGKVKGGAKYTKLRRPVRVERVWRCEEKGDALKLENRFKRLDKASKERLVSDPGSIGEVLGDALDVSLFTEDKEFEGDIPEAEGGDMEPVARMQEVQ